MYSLLKVENLHVHFKLNGGQILKAVDGVDFDIKKGEVLGLVGESGCGKTVFSLSIMRLVPPPGYIEKGEIYFNGQDLLKLEKKEMLKIRGRHIAMIFQNPQMSLNPVYTIGTQFVSLLRLHYQLNKKQARERALELLNLVRVPAPGRVMDSYPHQLSGGMSQRVMIAMAISCEPELLVADEPTSALDVTIQAQIVDLLLELKERFNMAILFVSHDLGVVANISDRVAVMYLGRIVEVADSREIFTNPLHPYTEILINSIPVLEPQKKRLSSYKIEGEIPGSLNITKGCRFKNRCPNALEECSSKDPYLVSVNEGSHNVACFLCNN
jgi:oligopeptide/dipeptide ABC transporter ATP-binding protein